MISTKAIHPASGAIHLIFVKQGPRGGTIETDFESKSDPNGLE